MVDPVVLRGVEDVLQRPHRVHALRVDPKLEESVELDVHHRLRGGNEQCQRQVERLKRERREKGEGKKKRNYLGKIDRSHDRSKQLEDGLPESGGKVVLLGAVVHLVPRPQQVDL